MNPPQLTTEQQEALSQNDGFVRGSSYILMLTEMYREMMGVGTDHEFAASLPAVDEAMEDLEGGRTISLEETKRRLDEKYGVHD